MNRKPHLNGTVKLDIISSNVTNKFEIGDRVGKLSSHVDNLINCSRCSDDLEQVWLGSISRSKIEKVFYQAESAKKACDGEKQVHGCCMRLLSCVCYANGRRLCCRKLCWLKLAERVWGKVGLSKFYNLSKGAGQVIRREARAGRVFRLELCADFGNWEGAKRNYEKSCGVLWVAIQVVSSSYDLETSSLRQRWYNLFILCSHSMGESTLSRKDADEVTDL